LLSEHAGLGLGWLARNSCLSVKPCILVGNKSDLARYVYQGQYTDKKKIKFLIYKEIQNGAVAKSYMRKDF
jgi:hypothetical protein